MISPNKVRISFKAFALLLSFQSSFGSAGESFKLKSGGQLFVEQDAAAPRQTVVISFRGAPAAVPVDQQGLLSVVADIMNEGPLGMTSEDFRKAQFLAGGDIQFIGRPMAFHVVIKAPTRQLQSMVDLSRRVLFNPKIDSQTFSRAKDKVLAQTKARFENMREALFYFAFRDVTKSHPLVLDGSGSPRTIGNVTIEKAQEFLPSILKSQQAVFSSVGPMASADLMRVLDQAFDSDFQQASPSSSAISAPIAVGAVRPATAAASASGTPSVNQHNAWTVKLIHKAGATDNQILFVFPEQVTMDREDIVVGRVAHELLGGGSSGRLGKTLREERGLTYHASSTISSSGLYWILYSFAGLEQTAPLLKGADEVLHAFKKEKIKESEVRLALQSRETAIKSQIELPGDRLLAQLDLRMRGLDPSFVDKQVSYLSQVNAKAVKSFIDNKVHTEGGYLYLMGDREKILPALKLAGYDSASVAVLTLSDI